MEHKKCIIVMDITLSHMNHTITLHFPTIHLNIIVTFKPCLPTILSFQASSTETLYTFITAQCMLNALAISISLTLSP
jgi:hypothetical protein